MMNGNIASDYECECGWDERCDGRVSKAYNELSTALYETNNQKKWKDVPKSFSFSIKPANE